MRVLYLLFTLSSLCFGLVVCNGASVRIPPRARSQPYKKPFAVKIWECSKIRKKRLNSVHKKHIFTLKPL